MIVAHEIAVWGDERGHRQCAAAVERGMCVVVRGLGGASTGDVAATMVVETMVECWRSWITEPPPGKRNWREALVASIQLASARIAIRTHTRDGGRLAPHLVRALGAAIAVTAETPEGILVAHVGDCRVYRADGETVTRLTEDHVLPIPDSDVPALLRILGTLEPPAIDVALHPADGTYFLSARTAMIAARYA